MAAVVKGDHQKVLDLLKTGYNLSTYDDTGLFFYFKMQRERKITEK